MKPTLNRSEIRLSSARSVLLQEAYSLKVLADQLNEEKFSKNFIKALHIIEDVKKTGKLIITGMGKSGHIGKKIAATFASMGTPSFFIHPGEASHGDMGMISKNDAVIAISNSGESKELFDILDYCNKFKIPVIGICRAPISTLAKKSNVALCMQALPEACPLGKAPTVSTTQTLALGDALAVVMAQRWGLTSDHYKNWHPGGKLGASMTSVKNLIDKSAITLLIKEGLSFDEIIKLFNKKPATIIVLNDKKEILGTITPSTLLMKKIEITKIPTLNEKSPAYEAGTALSDSATGFCFVTDAKGRFLGIINSKSLLNKV